jgi:small subunit ribosomal protein S16
LKKKAQDKLAAKANPVVAEPVAEAAVEAPTEVVAETVVETPVEVVAEETPAPEAVAEDAAVAETPAE